MPKNVMKLLKPSHEQGRNLFDLSRRSILTANFGELLPILSLETVPGDHIEIKYSDLLRAMPMVTSPFMRAKQHCELYFVPYTDIWHNFNQFMMQKDEPLSSALHSHTYLPFAMSSALRNRILSTAYLATNDVIGRGNGFGSRKIFNLLGYGDVDRPMPSGVDVGVNLFRLCAYNSIWYHYYRNPYYDNGLLNLPSGMDASYLFSLDDLACSSASNANIGNSTNYDVRLGAMLQMRYRQWKKDLFTGILPNSQFGNVSSVTVPTGGDLVNLNSPSGSGITLGTDAVSHVFGEPQATYGYARTAVSSTSFDVLALRKSQAIQIWRENAMRAGTRISDNMRAHYGDEPAMQRDHCPTFIGSVSSAVNISDVNATADTGTSGNQILGSVAGKGIASHDGKVAEFTAKDFGVIMAIYSILPEAEYNSDGIERNNQLLEMEDFFVPEYQNLGLEAVSNYTFSVGSSTPLGSTYGYAPRYYGYKTALDKVYGDVQCFAANNARIFAPWASPKYDVVTGLGNLGIPLSVLYVNPFLFDHNFNVGVSTADQFVLDAYFNINAARRMSLLGMPEY